MQTLSKSQFKSKLLEYLRQVEQNKIPLLVTHGGKPVVKVSYYKEDSHETLSSLRGSVISYQDPTEPVGKETWEVLK